MAAFTIKDDKGDDQKIDLANMNVSTNTGDELSAEQSDALQKLLTHGSLDKLDSADAEKLKDIVARIGSGQVPELAAAVLVRFDLSWVSIK